MPVPQSTPPLPPFEMTMWTACRGCEMQRSRWWQLWPFRRRVQSAPPVEMPAWIYSRGLRRNLSEACFPHRWLESHAEGKLVGNNEEQPLKADELLVNADGKGTGVPLFRRTARVKNSEIAEKSRAAAQSLERASQPLQSGRSLRTRVKKVRDN